MFYTGVESMTRVPMGLQSSLPKKNGFGHYLSPNIFKRYGVEEFSQFVGADMMAKKYGLSREVLDTFSLESHLRAAKAIEAKVFVDEILPLEARTYDPKTGLKKNLGELHLIDEGIRFDVTLEKLAALKPISEGGLLTPGSASQLCDGASGVIIVNEDGLKTLGVQPLARIHHFSVVGGDPIIMLESPLVATDKALKKAGMKYSDIDIFEINEAFASVPLAWLKHTEVDPQKLNPFGGAIALGHPLGGSGTKLLSTLVYGLIHQKKRFGLQSMCEGGGMANVTIIENMQ